MAKSTAKRKKQSDAGIVFSGDAKIIGPVSTGTTHDINYTASIVENTGQGAQIAQNVQGNVSQYQAPAGAHLETIQQLFNDVRSELEAQPIPTGTKAIASEYVNQLETQLTRNDAPPDGSIVKMAGSWLLANVPSILGTLTTLFVNPIVGKVVEAGGDIASRWLREKFPVSPKGV